ncbi:class D sortase [Paenactinomyces guangxiensis]|uniref:Class D sortase n=1 Tax=Paenactinomyces guangxiensis TaxID=1490290 RepID=A0A7W1WPQ1_9BACL|nr:class D sortase [Paenactinomyces guangxiensis]MBH8590936.1 class D sortase [Paenactinomyces guangxiensis]
MAYAGYSGVNYYQKLQVVREVRPDHQASAASNDKAVSKTVQTDDQPWVIVPKGERPKTGEHFADLVIPRLNAKIPIIEGTHEDELARGIGHYAGSVLPGEPDNAVLSGHRDTVFRRMGELKKGDELRVTSEQGTFVYVITRMWITKPDDRTVIVPHDKPVLTLTTCYPFSYIGPAPERYIIHSELKEKINETSRTAQGE